EWWRLPGDGIGAPKQLTTDGEVLRLGGVPSPDGRYIAHTDHDQRLWLFDTETRDSRQVDFSPQWGFDGPSWSPDSRWLAYAVQGSNSMYRIFVYRVADGSHAPVTSERFSSYSAQWSPDGRWLYFLSDRTFESRVYGPWGPRQPEPYFDRQTKIYLLPLRTGLRSPFDPPDELSAQEAGDAEADREADRTATSDGDAGEERAGEDAAPTGESDASEQEPDAPPEVEIDLEGIAARLREVPIPAGNYAALAINAERLFWIARDSSADAQRHLMALPIGHEDPEPLRLAEEIRGYELSGDGRQLLVRRSDDFFVIAADAGAQADLSAGRVDLSDWRFPIDPPAKWRQMFVESWRLERDYFYDPNMHGLDWLAILHKYLPLVGRVTTRGELADLQAQMASELSALHIGVWGGDHRESDPSVDVASLGARLRRDPEGGGYRVEHVYRSDPDYPAERAPLAHPRARVRAGEVIAAINGVPTLQAHHPGELLRGLAGQELRLEVIAPDASRRDLIAEAISSHRAYDLRYDEWEYTRRLRVDSLSAGEIGYVHLRDMEARNIAEWHRDFYPVFDRRGLIVDVRHNGGGNIDSWILARLMRTAWMYWQPRVGDPYWNMQHAFRGHICVLIDEWTMSDGEAFAEGFRRLGLGQLIGTRTWGGEIWLTHSNRLVDGGIVTAAEFGVYGPEGRWLIEGHGVEPDIEVDNLPHATFRGQDAQLDAAIAHLQALIREDPRDVPPPPPYPVLAPGPPEPASR
ncbi:MAG: protease, partial [Candidatus Eisenbacteria bacterium]|nr:protease [Candidatus Eisenbacteria bacterium]